LLLGFWVAFEVAFKPPVWNDFQRRRLGSGLKPSKV
jgi:hypothetical protein